MLRWLIHKDQSKASNTLHVVSHVDTVDTRAHNASVVQMLCYVNTVDTLVFAAFMQHCIERCENSL